MTAISLYSKVVALSTIFTVSAGAASYMTGFGNNPGDAAYSLDTAGIRNRVVGQDGWYSNDNATKSNFMVAPDGNQGAAIGGFFNTPVLVTTFLGHEYSGALTDTSFSVDFNLTSSSAGFPGADSFGFTFLDDVGNSVFSISFTPTGPETGIYALGWSTGNGPVTPLSAGFFAGSDYALTLSFSGSGLDAAFTGSLQGDTGPAVGFNGVVPTAGSAQLAAFGATYTDTTATNADNFLSFDNVAIVPEPTGLALAGVALGGMMLRRRRA